MNVKSLAARFGRTLVLLLLLGLTLNGVLTGIIDRVTAPIAKRNQEFLDTSIKDTAHLMIPIGAIDAAADIVEGSTVTMEAGVVFAKAGVDVEVGDALQPLLDYIHVAWRLLLISIVYLVSAKAILLGATSLSQPLLATSIISSLLERTAAMVVPQQTAVRVFLKRLSALFLLAALLFLLVIPLSVAGSAFLASQTTDPLRSGLWESFDRVGKVFSMDKFYAAKETKEKATVLADKLLEIGTFAKDATGDVAMSVCKLAAIKVLNGIVFPLVSLAFLIWIVRGCLYPALGLSDRSLATDDLAGLRKWIQKKEAEVPNKAFEAIRDSESPQPQRCRSAGKESL